VYPILIYTFDDASEKERFVCKTHEEGILALDMLLYWYDTLAFVIFPRVEFIYTI
jgi:hypothetical protein